MIIHQESTADEDTDYTLTIPWWGWPILTFVACCSYIGDGINGLLILGGFILLRIILFKMWFVMGGNKSNSMINIPSLIVALIVALATYVYLHSDDDSNQKHQHHRAAVARVTE